MQGPLVRLLSTRRPVIGLTPYVEQAQFGSWDRRCALIPTAYLEHVEAANGLPVVLPPSADADAAVRLLDGLVLPGGPDVDPSLYQADRHPLTDEPRPERDSWEVALLAAARRRGIPVLGICRGMQLLNVACGGDLVQALEETPHAALHRAEVGVFGSHPVRVKTGSWCASVLGESPTVPTYHHQAIHTVGAALRPVAWAEDGCIEAVEGVEGSLLVGVQWHPEQDARSPLVARFVEACAVPAVETVAAR
jgi:putative glutamine amidotransferase